MEKDRFIRKNLSSKEVHIPNMVNGKFPTNLKFTDPFLSKNEKLVSKIGMQYSDLDNMK